MQHVDEHLLETDIQARFGYLADFIQFSSDDIATIHAAAPALAPLVPGLVDAVYHKLFAYDCTKRHFLIRNAGYAGELPTNLADLTVDHPQIQFRKQHLSGYLVALVTRPYDGSLVRFLDGVGKIHTRSAGTKELFVPLVQMNALMGFVADAFTATIMGLGLPRTQEVATLRAFGKLLWIQNDLIVRHYATPNE